MTSHDSKESEENVRRKDVEKLAANINRLRFRIGTPERAKAEKEFKERFG